MRKCKREDLENIISLELKFVVHKEASIDAEVISLVMRVYKELGIEGVQLKINSMGCPIVEKNIMKH